MNTLQLLLQFVFRRMISLLYILSVDLSLHSPSIKYTFWLFTLELICGFIIPISFNFDQFSIFPFLTRFIKNNYTIIFMLKTHFFSTKQLPGIKLLIPEYVWGIPVGDTPEGLLTRILNLHQVLKQQYFRSPSQKKLVTY